MSLDAALDQALADHEPPPPPTIPESALTQPRPARPGPPTTPSRVAPLAARQQLVDVDPRRLHPDPDNPRQDVGDVAELAQSMHANGLLQPIVARRTGTDSRLVVVAGHRRLAAALRLGWTTVPVIVRRDMRPDDVLAAMLVENGQRRDLDPIEEARALSRLQSQTPGISHRSLADRVGRTQVHVSSRLALLSLPIEEQEMLRAGQMNLADAIRRGREASGNVRSTSTGSPHLGIDHTLSGQARARCRRLKHKAGGRNSVGGVACGECWESVIRADERQHLHAHSGKHGQCALCSGPYGSTPTT